MVEESQDMGERVRSILRYLDTLEQTVRFDSRLIFRYWGLEQEFRIRSFVSMAEQTL